MEPSRVRDPDDADRIDVTELSWLRFVMPVTEHYCRQAEGRDYTGKRLACWMHIRENTVPWLSALRDAGAEIAVGACNVDSTDDAAAALLVEQGVTVYGWRGMGRTDYERHMAAVRAFDADYLCDMGGELTTAYLDRAPPPAGALEATTSGIHVLRGRTIPFPVFDWNDIPLKDRLENRFHVGNEVWPVFSELTSMSLYGRTVLVIGYGPVGTGIAERARALGALVHVVDLDPVRSIEARHHGCAVVSLRDGLARCEIVVTATGVEGILREDELRRARPGAILLNAGHSNREIDVEWLDTLPHERMRPQIERFELGDSHLFLLARGSLVNLAGSTGGGAHDLFDLYTAVMLRGVTWLFDGGASDSPPGLQPYPAELEREIASLAVERAR